MIRAVGIDFGTSNCAAAVAERAVPRLLPLDGDQPLLPSVLYVDRAAPKPIAINANLLKRRLDSARASQRRSATAASAAKRKYVLLSDDELAARERAVLVREALMAQKAAEDAKSLAATLLGAQRLDIGSAALRARIENPLGGLYFRSPKRFLASDLRPEQRDVFQSVITTMLARIRERCESELRSPVTQVVLGRPVTYSQTADASADNVAISTMRAAAGQAGFSDVEFMLEPIAAAMEYERTLTDECVVLVVDAGGGTTDCTVVRLGPEQAKAMDRDSDVLSTHGCRWGGVDIDQALAWHHFMPLFGRDLLTLEGRPLPYTPFHQAVQVYDIPEQTSFYNSEKAILEFLARVSDTRPLIKLLRLLRGRLTDRLARSTELGKIALTDKEAVTVPLKYIDEASFIPLARINLKDSARDTVERMTMAANEAIRLAGAVPQKVFVTGGTAKSPVVADLIRRGLRLEAPIVTGDLFGSVASGLAIQAEKIF